MKKIYFILAIILIALIHPVYGFGGAITPPKIAVKVNASDLPKKVTVDLRIYNTNNYPVKITLKPQGDINNSENVNVVFSKNNFSLNAGAKSSVNLTFNIKKAGSYNGSIIVKFEKIGTNSKGGSYLKTSIAFPVSVEIKTVGKARNSIPGFFTIYCLIAIVLALLLKRKL